MHVQDHKGQKDSLVWLCPSYQRSYWNSHLNTTTHAIHIDPELVGHSVCLEKEKAPLLSPTKKFIFYGAVWSVKSSFFLKNLHCKYQNTKYASLKV